MKVAVGASSFAAENTAAMELLLAEGIEVQKNPYGRKMTEQEIIAHLQGADGLLAGLEPLNENVFSRAPDLKAVARIGIGMENVDLQAAQKRGIKVSNTPEGPTNAVAEMTLAALLAIGRQILPCNRDLHQGIWKKRIGFSLSGLRILLIGYGRIGKRVGELLQNLDMNLLIYDPARPEISVDLWEGIRMADVVSLHASGNREILSPETFSAMKKGVVILNCARGGLINEEALYAGLRSGEVAWYWGDVFPDEPYSGKLIQCENAVLTPHISTYSKQCRESMETQAVRNLLRDLK